MDLSFDEHIFDIAFHPERDVLAAGLITGEIVCKYTNEDRFGETAFTVKTHTDSCRTLAFGSDGLDLFSGGSDKSLLVTDAATGKMKLRKKGAHSDSINCLLPITESLIASGDDGGVLKLWDFRQKKEVRCYTDCTDYISDITCTNDGQTILVTSGDGNLGVFDPSKKKPVKISDNQEDELLSVALVRNEKKAVVGTDDGVLLFFSAGNWGDCTDRFPGHPSSIDAICKVDENTIATGSGDGLIRLIGLFPNRLIRVLGDHGNGSPIEKLRLCPDGERVASCALDNTVRFWHINPDEESQDVKDDAAEEEGDEDDDSRPKKRAGSGSDDDDADSDESPVEEMQKKKKTRKKAKRGLGGKVKNPFFNGLD
ncbi:WD domain repeat-containing protein 55 [Phlyctochytrium bullatum]|nr:WD domain repeat-containing protein 55 [Phlyctochytrium bullatum]